MVTQTPATSPPQETDIAIIGAGPVGLFGVFAGGMLGLTTHVFDALPEIGGQCTALYPEKPIYDIPAYPSIKAGDLIQALETQAAPFHPVYHLNSPVIAIDRDQNGLFNIKNAGGVTIRAHSVVLAVGAGAFGPNRPPLADLEQYENKSVFYAVRDPSRFTDKTLVIAGGGDSAIDWANILAKTARKIYLVHRRDGFRAAPASLAQIDAHTASGTIEKIIPYQLAALKGTNGQITHVQVADLDGATRDLPADALLCFYGLSTSLGILGQMNLAVQGNHITIDPTTAATSLAGIYAVGDIATYNCKQRLILTGFAEMSQAAQAIYSRIHPGQPLHHEHSTTKGIPGAIKA